MDDDYYDEDKENDFKDDNYNNNLYIGRSITFS
jgi:hypothetical protein